MPLELKNVTKRVGAEVHIHETNLVIEEGTFNILLGSTLAGKTTLMRLMAGIQTPTSGSILNDGKDVTGVPVQKRNVSMVYQQFINYPNFSVYENIASPLRVAGLEKTEIDKSVRSAADLLRLTPMLERRPMELSGGQQQRTAIARAIVKDSDLILLDEPLANLDYKLREEMRDELPKLFLSRKRMVVYATTEPMEALLFGGNTATLYEGQVTQFGPTSRIYRRSVRPNQREGLFRSTPQYSASGEAGKFDYTNRNGQMAGRRKGAGSSGRALYDRNQTAPYYACAAKEKLFGHDWSRARYRAVWLRKRHPL